MSFGAHATAQAAANSESIKTTMVEERQVLLVAGGSRVGTLYGAYNLLYRLGCRWFAPGEIQEQLSRISKQSQAPSQQCRRHPGVTLAIYR